MKPVEEQNVWELLDKFFYYLDLTEESDSGTLFHPTMITSCRAMDGVNVNKILNRLKELTTENRGCDHA